MDLGFDRTIRPTSAASSPARHGCNCGRLPRARPSRLEPVPVDRRCEVGDAMDQIACGHAWHRSRPHRGRRRSSGGHLALATAMIEGFDEAAENLAVRSTPNALVLFNP